MVKKLPMILMIVAPYIFGFIVMDSVEKGIFTQLGIGIILYTLVLVLNLVYAFLLPRLGFDARQMLFWNMLLKLCHIPIYLCVIFIVMVTHVFIIPLMPFLFLFDYSMLIASSAYGIRGLLKEYKSKNVTLKYLVVHAIAHLMFCTDVFSSIYCYMKVRKAKEHDRLLMERPDWETIVETMYDKELDAFEDEVVKVIYSKDKTKRYVILKEESGILTWQLEYIYLFDDDEWNYICNQENAFCAMWEPYYTEWGVSHFEREEELLKELSYEPEYKQFF